MDKPMQEAIGKEQRRIVQIMPVNGVHGKRILSGKSTSVSGETGIYGKAAGAPGKKFLLLPGNFHSRQPSMGKNPVKWQRQYN